MVKEVVWMNFKETKFRVYCRKCDSQNVDFFIMPSNDLFATLTLKCNFCGTEEVLS